MHYLRDASPFFQTVPTIEMRSGDFSALMTPIYDPTTTVCIQGSCTRRQYSYMGRLNVIDPAKIAPQAKYLQQFLPAIAPGSPISNNYLAGFPTGFNYRKVSAKVDFDVFPKHRISLLYTYGNRAARGCCNQSGLPERSRSTSSPSARTATMSTGLDGSSNHSPQTPKSATYGDSPSITTPLAAPRSSPLATPSISTRAPTTTCSRAAPSWSALLPTISLPSRSSAGRTR